MARRLVHILLDLVLITWILIPGTAGAQTSFSGRVVAVHDGDTLTLLDERNEQVKIRLAEIDAPEGGQPYGKKAKQELSALAFGKTVNAIYVDTDRYGRIVAHLSIGDLNINAEMIRRGAAWAYRQYLKDNFLLKLEEEARQARVGIWALQPDQQIPPWKWRQFKKQRQSTGARDR